MKKDLMDPGRWEIEHESAESYVRGGLGWILGRGISPRGWSGTGTEKSWHQACQSSRGVWIMLSGTGSDSWGCPVQGQDLVIGPFQLRDIL